MFFIFLVFQWFDMDMTSGDPMSSNPDGGDIIGSLEGPVPVIRLYGVTNSGHSVMAFVHGFTPYFYISLASNIDASDSNLGLLRVSLDQKVFS